MVLPPRPGLFLPKNVRLKTQYPWFSDGTPPRLPQEEPLEITARRESWQCLLVSGSQSQKGTQRTCVWPSKCSPWAGSISVYLGTRYLLERQIRGWRFRPAELETLG